MLIVFLYNLLMTVMIIYILLLIFDTFQRLIERKKILNLETDIKAIRICEAEKLEAAKEIKEKLERLNRLNKHDLK